MKDVRYIKGKCFIVFLGEEEKQQYGTAQAVDSGTLLFHISINVYSLALLEVDCNYANGVSFLYCSLLYSITFNIYFF